MRDSLKLRTKNWRSRWSLKFYLRIYLAMLASLLVSVVLVGLLLQYLVNNPEYLQKNQKNLSEIAGDVIAPIGSSSDKLQASLRRWQDWMGTDLALYDAAGKQISFVGKTFPARFPEEMRNGWHITHPRWFSVQLPDRRWLLAGERGISVSLGQLVGAIMLALAVALGSYPIIRRLTKRLERLQSSVDALGEGQLSTRVPVEGDDEVAHLATSFNQSAARIEALVMAQKSLLANASHELRSPLTRIRMAVELLQAQAPAEQSRLGAELATNINELDQLIEEILLSSRLEALRELPVDEEEIDLAGLLAEECARVQAELKLEMVSTAAFRGDAKLLRRLIRNLLENARRYGDNSPILASLRVLPQALEIDICDRGKGVPTEQRERIFEPFYRLPGASETDGGVGLGLSLVKQIAQRHDGQVQCLAGVAGGSCFRVSLPRPPCAPAVTQR